MRVDVRPMFGPLWQELVVLLRQLPEPAWSAPTVCGAWTVHDVAAHLLGVELANVAGRRDGVRTGPPPEQSLPEWLAAYNEQWVGACRRLSSRLLIEHLATAAADFEGYAVDLDIDRPGEPVSWAGSEPAPVWLDVAREYTERWVHQQQIREAVGRPHLDPEQARAVIMTFVHALRVALGSTPAVEGATIAFTVTGDGGGDWQLTCRSGEWQLRAGAPVDPAASVITTVEGAWRLFTQHPRTPPPTATGDPALTEAVRAATAIIR
jgi:uncharacterized protein (TIGR03083 family)